MELYLMLDNGDALGNIKQSEKKVIVLLHNCLFSEAPLMASTRSNDSYA